MVRLVLALFFFTGCKDPDSDGKTGGRDCDDTNPAVFKGAEEVCDGLDNDCDGQIDEDVAIVAFWDRDGDGFGDPEFARRVCTLPDDGSLVDGDCDDADASVHPDGVEICDEKDNNCNGETDEGVTTEFFEDADGDGFGAGSALGSVAGCWPDEGYAPQGGDCDDTLAEVNPALEEVCDGVDNDCDGLADNGLPDVVTYADADGDGSGDPLSPVVACGPLNGAVDNARDCDDTDAAVGAFATDLPDNGLDEDCDGFTDEIDVGGYASPQDAVDAAPDGSVVQFGDGLHVVNLDLRGRQLTVAGNGCENTELYGALLGSVLRMDAGQVTGMTLSGGSGTVFSVLAPADGGGLFVDGGEVRVSDACFAGNTVGGRGGAIAVHEGTLWMDGVLLRDNDAEEEGGAVYGSRSAIHGTGLQAYENTSTTEQGGAICIEGGTLDVDHSVFAYNHAQDAGAAISVEPTRPEHPGEAGRRQEFPTAVLDHLTIHRNTNNLGYHPSALFTDAGELSIRRSIITDNMGNPIDSSDEAEMDAVIIAEDLGIAGNDDSDIELSGQPSWLASAVRERPDYVRDDRSAPDLRLMATSPMRDQLTEADRDGSAGDLGAFGGAAKPGWDEPLYDTDGDGLSNGFELRHGLLLIEDDASEDPDLDGLDNLTEQTLGSSPHDADSDADGISDADEVAAGHDPTDRRDQVPVADAGSRRLVLTGRELQLDNASFDPNDDALTSTWTLDAPGGSALTQVDDPAAPFATFTPDAAGTYVVTLEVSDGIETDAHTIEVRAYDGLHVPDDVATLDEALDQVDPGDAVALAAGRHFVNHTAGGAVVVIGAEPGAIVEPITRDSVFDITGGSLVLGHLAIEHGDARDRGGAVSMGSETTLELIDVRFAHNRARTFGGAVFIAEDSLVYAEDLVMVDNAAEAGGGLYAEKSVVEIAGCRFSSNHSVGHGAAILIDRDFNEDPLIHHCTFAGNFSEEQSIVYVNGQSVDTVIHDTAFLGNVARHGLYIDRGDSFLHGLSVEGNTFANLAVGGRAWEATVLGSQHSSAIGTPFLGEPIDSETRREPSVMHPAWWIADEVDNDIFAPRLTASVFDRSWVDARDADGSRADVGPSGLRRSDARFRLDVDGDGLSDGWEVLQGLDPTRDDASEDLDGDGLDNLREHIEGTRADRADTDGDGLSDSAEVAADDNPLNPSAHVPVAIAGERAFGLVDTAIALDGTESVDPDGAPLTYAWSVIYPDDGSATFDDPTSSTPFLTSTRNGRHVVSLTVDDGGAVSKPTRVEVFVGEIIRVPEDRPSVDLAVVTAASGDVVRVGPGSWPTNLKSILNAVTIEGSGADQTVLVPGRVGEPIITHDAHSLLTLRDLSLSEGLAERGAAVNCHESELLFEHVAFEGNVAEVGGALLFNACSAELRHTRFDHNRSALTGGAVQLLDESTVSFVDAVFTENEAEGSGGAIFVRDSSLSMDNGLLNANASGLIGGAIQRIGTVGMLDLDHVTVVGNIAASTGGISTTDERSFIENSIFVFNNSRQLTKSGTQAISVRNTIFYNPATLALVTPATILTAPGVSVQNPQLVRYVGADPSLLDAHLRPSSPARDIGSDVDPDGTQGDLGYYGGTFAPGDWNTWFIDDDGDGMSDAWEVLYGLDPTVDDTGLDLDGDGIENGTEHTLQTRPDMADTDGDGVDDHTEWTTGKTPTNPNDHRPMANTGGDSTAPVGSSLAADGSDSVDPNDLALTYSWTLVAKPGRSALTTADITTPDQPIAGFTPDTPGAFVLELVVNNGVVDSLPASVRLTAEGDVLVPDDYASVSEAVDAIAVGYTVEVGPGMFIEHVDLAGKSIVIEGAGAGLTWLDGDRNGTVVESRDGGEAVLRDLTLSGGFAPEGGGIWLEDSNIELQRVHLQDNLAARGAAIYAEDANIIGDGVRFVDNETGSDGGAVYLNESDLEGVHALFARNTAVGGSGGAAYLYRGTLDLENAIFSDNIALDEGGALALRGVGIDNSVVDLRHVTATFNESTAGGFAWGNRSVLQLDHTILNNNRANDGATIEENSDFTVTAIHTWSANNFPAALYDVSNAPTAPSNVDDNAQVDASNDMDWMNDTWTLLPTSPALDAGDPDGPADPDGSAPQPGAFGGPLGDWTP